MNDQTKTCPFCAEQIKAAAIVCRYCRRDLNSQPSASTATNPVTMPSKYQIMQEIDTVFYEIKKCLECRYVLSRLGRLQEILSVGGSCLSEDELWKFAELPDIDGIEEYEHQLKGYYDGEWTYESVKTGNVKKWAKVDGSRARKPARDELSRRWPIPGIISWLSDASRENEVKWLDKLQYHKMIKLLHFHGVPETLGPLSTALRHDYKQIRKEAIHAIIYLDDPRAREIVDEVSANEAFHDLWNFIKTYQAEKRVNYIRPFLREP
jgi:hypothetical protein